MSKVLVLQPKELIVLQIIYQKVLDNSYIVTKGSITLDRLKLSFTLSVWLIQQFSISPA